MKRHRDVFLLTLLARPIRRLSPALVAHKLDTGLTKTRPTPLRSNALDTRAMGGTIICGLNASPLTIMADSKDTVLVVLRGR